MPSCLRRACCAGLKKQISHDAAKFQAPCVHRLAPPLRPSCVLADPPTAPIASLPRLLAPTTEEFVAHSSNVTCLQIGRKSGQVLVTGGEDKSVNMWRLGKHTNIMSLPGHTSAISSVAFDPHEEVVVAGSQNIKFRADSRQDTLRTKTS